MAFAFMPNHIHLLLRQLIPNGISTFIHKFGTGRVMHFNARHERKGTLFQGRFGAEIIDSDEYLRTVFVYIHTNPISLIEPGWKDKGIVSAEKVKNFLEEYRWSSYSDYLGKNNLPSITERDFTLKSFGGSGKIKEFVDAWIDHKNIFISG